MGVGVGCGGSGSWNRGVVNEGYSSCTDSGVGVDITHNTVVPLR